MSEIEVLQFEVIEDPQHLILKRKINELTRDVNHLNEIVASHSFDLRLIKKELKDIRRSKFSTE